MISFIYYLFLCPVLSITSPDVAVKDNWQNLSGENYSVNYPSDWTTDVSGSGGTTFYIYSPLLNDEDAFSDNINLMEQNLQGLKMDLAGFVTSSLEALPVYFKNYQLVENKVEKKSGHECSIVEYKGDLNGFSLHFLQYLWVIDEKAYILTFTTEETSFDGLKSTGLEIMDSFKLKLKKKN